jgi:hypothetical protein
VFGVDRVKVIDPRDKYFYQLQKKDKDQLTLDELKTYIDYCTQMISYVKDKKGRKGWKTLLQELQGLKEAQ